MEELALRLIGVPELTLAGAPVRLRRRGALALLAYLVLTARPRAREELAALLAGDVADGSARKLLRNALADLNEHGLGSHLTITRQVIAFNSAAPHTLDVARLDELVAQGPAADSADLAWAAQRCDLELLAGMTLRDAPDFEGWLLHEREHRARQLMQLAQRLLARHQAGSRLDEGIALARRMLAVEPWQEDVQRRLMLLLARDGQLSAALAQYERCRRLLDEELGVAPQAETTALYERLRGVPSAPHNNLPTGAGQLHAGLVGRGDELAAITRNLTDPACRLLTLVGLSGSGKTSLALAAAGQLAAPTAIDNDHPFADGIILVSVASAVDDAADNAERRIATAIGLALELVFFGKADRLDQVIAYLEARRMLLVLDMLEPAAGGASALRTVLQRAPGVSLLVTSRSLLRLPEEWAHYVGGLALPGSIDDVERSPAGRLFMHEARRANARLSGADTPDIARICALTGGSPLALKIAAGWLHAVSCAEVARQLESGGALLDEAALTEDNRRVSIRALMESVWAGLPGREQLALRRLAVFPDQCDPDAAAAVGVPLSDLVALNRLSLLERSAGGGFALHPLVRRQAAAQLARRPDENVAARTAHAEYFASFAHQHAPALRERREAHANVAAELPNLYAAWAWAVDQCDVGLLTRLWQPLATWNQLAGLHGEWADMLAGAVTQLTSAVDIRSHPELPSLLGWLCLAQADALHWHGELDRADLALAAARRYAETTASAALMARVYLREGRLLHMQGRARPAIAALRRAQAFAGDAEDPRLEAHTMLSLSYALTDHGDLTEADTVVGSARARYRAIGDRLSLGRTALHTGRLLATRGNFSRARVLLEQSLHDSRAFHDRPSEAQAAAYAGLVYGEGLGRHRDADLHLGHALYLAETMGDRAFESFVQWAQGRNALHMGDLSRAGDCFERALTAARHVGSPAAESRALTGLGQLALARGDALTAEDRSEQALRLATDAERRHEQALALLLLGQAGQRLGRAAVAADAYGRARSIAALLPLPYLHGDATAGLADLARTEAEPALAARHAAQLLTYLHEHGLAGCTDPGWVALSCWCALLAAGDPRAAAAREQGAAILERRAEALPGFQRSRYLQAFPERRALLKPPTEARAARQHAVTVTAPGAA